LRPEKDDPLTDGDMHMKKNIARTIAGMAGLALAPAFAQSSVALYGLVDLGLSRIDDVGGRGVTQMRSGNAFSSRWGMRGTEDLGGGLKAVFTLEAGINPTTGAASTPAFNRQSWVGLSSEKWGRITLGRQLPSIADVFISSLNATYLGNHAAAMDGAAIGAGSSLARFNNMMGGTRVDNAIKYQSPSFAGFKAHAMVTVGDVPGSSSAGRMLSLGGSYVSNTLEGGLVYHERRCLEVEGCAPGKSKNRIVGLGAAYKLNGGNGARFGAIYSRQKSALNVQGNDASVLDLLVRVPLGQWTVTAGYQFLDDRSSAKQDVRQLNLGATYFLSKRTSLYGLYSHQSVKNGGKAGMYSVTSGDGKQNQLSAGIVHTF
jgi:predicted porin